MKNQFVADINDYFKYGLLRILAGQSTGTAPIGIWWMLTCNDAGNHGNKLDYMADTHYRDCDPELLMLLREISEPSNRHVFAVEERGAIPRARYWPSRKNTGKDPDELAEMSHEKLADPFERMVDFIAMRADFKSCEAVFVDPDNGIETRTASSERYVRWAELVALFAAGKSLIVYQHKPQGESLDIKLPALAKQARELMGTDVFSVACGRGARKGEVGFLIIPQKNAAEWFKRSTDCFLNAYRAFSRCIPAVTA